MMIAEIVDALGEKSAIRVVHRSGKKYVVEHEVITANANEHRPYIYGWPVVPKWHPSYGRVRWFFLDSVVSVEND